MPPDVSTVNDDPPILSDREFLDQLAEAVANLSTGVANVLKSANLIMEGQALQAKQLDHIDTMCHETAQFIEEHRPALAKALAFLSPGRSVRDYLGKGARHERD